MTKTPKTPKTSRLAALTTALKTPLSHPVAQWAVIGGVLLCVLLAWTAPVRGGRPVGDAHKARGERAGKSPAPAAVSVP